MSEMREANCALPGVAASATQSARGRVREHPGGSPDIVRVFRRHDDVPEVARQAVGTGAQTPWLQPDSWGGDAASIADEAGLSVAKDRCLETERARFHGGLRLAGLDTGVISSRRQLLSR